MEEVRLWKIVDSSPGGPAVHRVDGVDATATERLLEDVLAHFPEVLMEDLTIIGRQNETAGGPLDLLGLDDDGRLVVFELKRGELTRDAVAQVLDYASWLAGLEPDELSEHVTEMSGRGGTEKMENFAVWYHENYSKSLAEIGRPRMVLVGLGADEKTKRMVEFLATANVDMSLITFYGFSDNGQTLLARQVEVEAKATKQTNEYRATKAANERKFELRLKESGLEGIYSQLLTVLQRSLGNRSTAYPNATGHTFYFAEQTESGTPTNRAYVGLSVPDAAGKTRKVVLTIQPRAINDMDTPALDQLASRLGSPAMRKPSGLVELTLDGATPAATLEAGLMALGNTVVQSWERRITALQAVGPGA